MPTSNLHVSTLIAFMLLSMQLCSAAETKTCTRPLSLTSSRVTKCRYLIVGGGPGGMFSAYALRHLGSDVCILDRAGATFGATQRSSPELPSGVGKILDYGNAEAVFGECALRVNVAQKPMRCLFEMLNVTNEESPYDILISSRGRWARETSNPLLNNSQSTGVFNLQPADPAVTDLEDALQQYALLAKTSVNPLTGKTVSPHPATKCGKYTQVTQYLLDTIGEEATNFLISSIPYRSTVTLPLDVCQFIEWWKFEYEVRCCTDLYPAGGWSEMFLRLTAEVKKSGVRFFRGVDIKCMYDLAPGPHSERYMATTAKGQRGWAAERMIITAGPVDMVQMDGSLGALLAKDLHVTSIQPVEVVTYNAYYPERFWQPFVGVENTVLELYTPPSASCLTRSEFPGTSYLLEVNATRPLYTDDPVCIAMWRALYAQGGIEAVREQVRRDLERLLGVQVPEPTFDFWTTKNNGWHFMKPSSTEKNITIEAIAAFASQPLGKENLCLVGEPYSLINAGWAQGAWDAMVACMKANFMDVMTPEARDALEYIESGCGGKDRFDNEEWPGHNEIASAILPPSAGRLV